MLIKKNIIRTGNNELYNKLTQLNFKSEVHLSDVTRNNMQRILKSLNKFGASVSCIETKKGYTIKKLKPVNIDVYRI